VNIVRALSTHSDRLERWLGPEEVERISLAMRGVKPEYQWYGPPIAVANAPGRIYASRDGDFVGPIRGGQFGNILDFYERRLRRAGKEWARQQRSSLNAIGFSSLSDLIVKASAGGLRQFTFQKNGTTGVVAATNTLWFVGGQPAAGAAAAAAPGGTVPTDATTGSWLFDNPPSGNSQHFVSAFPLATVSGNTLLLYDRLFSVTKTMNSTATEAVTGVPTRYQGNTIGAQDYAGGNFLMIECRTVLPATAHNWTVCTYTDQDGNAGATLPSVTGNSANIVNRLDQPAATWFCPLAAGDTGIDNLTQMQCSALVASGNIDFTIGHPLAWISCPLVNTLFPTDGINSAFNLTRIFDDACMAFLEVSKSATTATSYVGSFTTCYT
jgi:hypothetical protein